MISTHEIKRDRFKVFRVGNPLSKEIIFLMGSCRVVSYLNYLDIWNRSIGNNRFLIYAIDPYDFNWDDQSNRVDLESTLIGRESDSNLLGILKSTTIFIHEHFSHFGIFNVDRSLPKHIYQFGMAPLMDITIPNFHDVFMLFNDFAKFSPFKEEASAVRGNLTPKMESKIVEQAKSNLNHWGENCMKSDFPQMKDFFMSNFLKTRFFWTFNHITRNFSTAIWQFMNENFLNLPETDAFKKQISDIEIVSDPRTPLCQYDIKHFRYDWAEPISDFAAFNKFR